MKKFSFTKGKLRQGFANNFSKKDLFFTTVLFIVSGALMCYIHKLEILYSIIVVICMVICVPFILASYLTFKSEKKRFNEYCLYFENMKIYYKIHHKINTSLELTLETFDKKSKMYSLINKALEELSKSGDYEKALALIEKNYSNSYLTRFHSLLIVGEKQGIDSVFQNLDRINYHGWKNGVNTLQRKKKSARYIFYIIAILCIVISSYSVIIYNGDEILNSLFINANYQLYTFIELELLILSFVYIYCSIVNKKWIKEDE